MGFSSLFSDLMRLGDLTHEHCDLLTFLNGAFRGTGIALLIENNSVRLGQCSLQGPCNRHRYQAAEKRLHMLDKLNERRFFSGLTARAARPELVKSFPAA
jgi:hypothetical protein